MTPVSFESPALLSQKESEYDQQIPQSQTTDEPHAERGRDTK